MPNKWLVAFIKTRNVRPGQFWRGTLSFGKEELSRWAGGAQTGKRGMGDGDFKVIPGKYLLIVVDQCGDEVANLTLRLT